MSEYTVPKGCTGLTMRDGSRLDAHSGRVTVDNPAHARQIEFASKNSGGMIGQSLFVPGVGVASRKCACGFVAFTWQSKCPKCGAVLGRDCR